MKRSLMILVSALLVTGINGCGSSDTKSGTSAVTINLGETRIPSPSGKMLAASSIPTAVASVRFTISAPDMATIERTVSVEGRTSISETFDVPNGTNRHFLVEVMDSSGNVLYRGDTYANLDGTPVALTIAMLSTSGVSAKFPIATTTAYEVSISAAFDGTNYLIGVGTSPTGTGWSTNVQLIAQSGEKVGSLVQSGCQDGFPWVAFGGSNYLVIGGDCDTWTHDIWGRFVSPSGTLGNNFPIVPGTEAEDPEWMGVAFGGGNYLMVYDKIDYPTTLDRIVYGRTVSTSGTVGDEIRISSGYGSFGRHSVAFDGTNFLVVWTDDTNGYEVKGRFVTPAGTLGTEFSINASTFPSDNPLTVTFDGTNYLVVWTDEVSTGNWDVFGQLIDKSGNKVGGVITVSNAAVQQFYPRIAFDGTNYLVTWTDMRNDANNNWVCDSGEGTCWDIYGQYVSTSGTLVGSEFVINNDAGNQFGGVVGYAGGKYFVIINTGAVPEPPGCTEGCDIATEDVYGVFVTPTP